MHADVAQIALDDEERGEHVGHVARRRAAVPPEPEHGRDHRRPQQDERRHLRGAVVRAAHPGALRPPPPFVEHMREPAFLARLRAEGLDDRVAADRVGKRAAHARVPRIGEARRRRHIDESHGRGHGDEDGRAERHDETHHRPVQAEEDRRSEEDHERRQERQEERVVEDVERPHAAGDLPHRRAGEAVGVPGGREMLHPAEGILRDGRHDAERHAFDAPIGDMPAQHHHRAEPDDGGQRQDRGAKRRLPVPIDVRHGVDEIARIDRHQHVGECRQRQQESDRADELRLAPPMVECKAKDSAERVRTPVEAVHHESLSAERGRSRVKDGALPIRARRRRQTWKCRKGRSRPTRAVR